MLVNLLKSKILRASVTETRLDYEGSLAIDEDLMDAVGLLCYEKILVGNINNGKRFETYAIPAPRGSKMISLRGAAAHMGSVDDLLVIMSFAFVDEKEVDAYKPKTITLSNGNSEIVKSFNVSE